MILPAVPVYYKVKKKARSDQDQLKAVKKREEKYYKKWESTEKKYSSLKPRHEQKIRCLTQSSEEFKAKWKRAENTLKQKEVEIEKVT